MPHFCSPMMKNVFSPLPYSLRHQSRFSGSVKRFVVVDFRVAIFFLMLFKWVVEGEKGAVGGMEAGDRSQSVVPSPLPSSLRTLTFTPPHLLFVRMVLQWANLLQMA